MNRAKKLLWALLAFSVVLTGCAGKEKQIIEAEETTVSELTEDPQPYEIDCRTLLEEAFEGLSDCLAEDLEVEQNDTGVTLLSYTGVAQKVKIPDFVGGRPITKIADEAFAGQDAVTVLILPATVTEFGANILSDCTSLQALRTPLPTEEGKTYFGYLFGATSYQTNGVQALRNVDFLDVIGDLTAVPAHMFYDCNDLLAVRLPSSVKELGQEAFFRCESLMWINVDSLVTLGVQCFAECRSLGSLAFSESAQSFGFGCLEGCSALRQLTLPFVGETQTTHRTLRYLFGAEESLSSAQGFYPSMLRKIFLLDSCTSLGDESFRNCTPLREIRLSDALVSIGIRAFSGCEELTELTFPDSLRSIGSSAFLGCLHLKRVTFGKNLTEIGAQAFQSCVSLESVALPDSLSEIPDSCFFGCAKLQTVTYGETVRVGKNAFYGCPYQAEK